MKYLKASLLVLIATCAFGSAIAQPHHPIHRRHIRHHHWAHRHRVIHH